jgi:hypothetical protein
MCNKDVSVIGSAWNSLFKIKSVCSNYACSANCDVVLETLWRQDNLESGKCFVY